MRLCVLYVNMWGHCLFAEGCFCKVIGPKVVGLVVCWMVRPHQNLTPLNPESLGESRGWSSSFSPHIFTTPHLPLICLICLCCVVLCCVVLSGHVSNDE